MRIAYVSLHWPRTRNSGVGKKIHSQLAAWRAMGHEARLFMHTTPYEPQSELIEADYFFYAPSSKLKMELNRIAAMSRMLEVIGKYKPDLIYLRYAMYVFSSHRLMDIAPVVSEINTDDRAQHKGLGRIYSLYNRLTRGILLRRARGLVAVSHELAVLPAFASFRKPTVVIANGIDMDSVRSLPAPDNDTPHLFFMGTPGYTWHGVDKLVTLARRYPDLSVHVVGYDSIDDMKPLPANLHLHGYLNREEYVKLLCQSDVALSTLALHRNNMDEASTLKSRECLAYGLPMVFAYRDTDLDELDCDFLLKIPNRPDNIENHAALVREFAYSMRGQRVDRNLIRNQIDSGLKEEQRLAFFEQVIQNSER